MNLELQSSTNGTIAPFAKIEGERGWMTETKMSLHSFSADHKIMSLWNKCVFLASYGTSYKLLPVAR